MRPKELPTSLQLNTAKEKPSEGVSECHSPTNPENLQVQSSKGQNKKKKLTVLVDQLQTQGLMEFYQCPKYMAADFYVHPQRSLGEAAC